MRIFCLPERYDIVHSYLRWGCLSEHQHTERGLEDFRSSVIENQLCTLIPGWNAPKILTFTTPNS